MASRKETISPITYSINAFPFLSVSSETDHAKPCGHEEHEYRYAENIIEDICSLNEHETGKSKMRAPESMWRKIVFSRTYPEWA